MFEVVTTRSSTLKEAEAKALVGQVERIISARGKSVISLDLHSANPDWPDTRRLLMGPTGNLRAPTLRAGKSLLVGFNAEAFADVLG